MQVLFYVVLIVFDLINTITGCVFITCMSDGVCVSSYYGLWMWFPELFARVEDGGSPCANSSLPSPLQNQSCYPVKTAGRFPGPQSISPNMSLQYNSSSLSNKHIL